MSVVVISTLIARSFSRESIYTLRLVRRGIDIHRREQADVFSGITVGEAMSRNFPTVLPTTPIAQLMDEIHHTGHHGFPVVDENGHLCGCVTLQDVEAAMSKKNPGLVVNDIATKSPLVAYPDQSIHEALSQFGGRDVGRIPVVSRDDPKKLLGVLRRHDIIRAYVKATGSEPQRTNEDKPW
jgi:CIC family chloride channel protein